MLFQNSRLCFATLHTNRRKPLMPLDTQFGSKQWDKKQCHCQSKEGTKWQPLASAKMRWFVCDQAARKRWRSIPPCGERGCEQSTITSCTLPRRPARVRMSFSISVYISSSEKRPIPWPYISRFTMPLVRWQKIHFSKSLKGPKSETIFCVSWRFSTHWQ